MPQRSKADSPTKTCTRPGCSNPLRAKDLCASHYNRQYHPQTPTPTQCAACGVDVVRYTTRKRKPTCSERCRYFVYYGRWPEQGKQRVLSTPKSTPKTRFISCACRWCGATFVQDVWVTGAPMHYCSTRCAKRAERMRRRGREAEAIGCYTWTEVVSVFLAIGKRCAYCASEVRSADLQPDHVVPLSRGGSNSITNIVPSCRACNTDKRDLLLPDWYADRERRGLPAVQLSAQVTHLT